MIEQINKINIFSELNDNEMQIIEKYFSLKTYEKGETLIAQDDIRKELFIVLNGKIVSTLKIPGSIDRKHGEYCTGDFFGEMSLFGNKPSFDTFYAAEKSHLLTFQEKELIELIEKNSDIAVKFIYKILNLTIQRFRESSKFLSDVVQWGESASRRVITDELTGVYNRAFLEDALENFFNISMSNNKPLSLFMLDIDNFGLINDSLGHDAGNKIIFESINLIKKIISKHGIIARYGGDEFSILLPEADLEKAMSIAEQIRRDIDSHDFTEHLMGEDIAVSISIGVSSFPDTATDLTSFKEKADASLYQAKELGRNRVACVE